MSLRRLGRNAIASILSVTLSALLLFELYRFLVQTLGPAQVGIWSLVMASSAVARLSEFGIGGGIVRFVASDLGEGRPARAAATVGMAFAAMGIVSGLAFLLLMPVLRWLVDAVIGDPQAQAAARDLLPWAVGSLWLTALANLFAGTLDGAQRSDLRMLGLVCASVVQLLAAYWLVTDGGLAAMGPVQLIFATFNLAVMALLSWRILDQPLVNWLAWDKARGLALLRYGGSFQLAALGQMFFEPSVKWLLGVFGSLTLVGYFEMANRAIVQFRQVIAAAYQMLVPYFAHRIGSGQASSASIQTAYSNAFRALVLIMVPYFALVGMLLPMLLTVWLGKYSEQFIWVGTVCLAGWAFNTLATPAFNLYLAIGRLRWTVLTQLTIGVLNLVLASLGGWFAGGPGVIVGAMLALSVGSLVVIRAFHHEYSIRWRQLYTRVQAITLVFGIASVVAGLWFSREWHGVGQVPMFWLAVAGLSALVMLLAAWSDPLRAELLARLNRPG